MSAISFVAACGDGTLSDPTDGSFSERDATLDSGPGRDSGPLEPDLGISDFGTTDAGAADLGMPDLGVPDTGPIDTGAPDAGAIDAESPDLGALDADTIDAGSPDLGAADAGTIDAGTIDAGAIDAGSGPPVPADMQALLDLMNAARLATGSAPLVWNAGVAATADDWAQGCTWMHASMGERQYMGTTMGENLGAGSGTSWNAAMLGQGWVDEEQFYDCPANTCAVGEVCGHYTQIIWRNSTEVGCAIRTCTTGSPFGNGTGSWRFLVCRYLPAGNYNNQRPIPVGDCP